jgi:hypothetical protein
MASESEKDGANQSWPGKESRPQPNPSPNDSAQFHWHPTDFGPGMGPDLSKSNQKSSSRPSKPNSLPQPVPKVQHKENCSIVHTVEGFLKYQVGDQCPNCDFAKLKMDADDQISCPICGFGGARGCT